jgi:hypothetical protein
MLSFERAGLDTACDPKPKIPVCHRSASAYFFDRVGQSPTETGVIALCPIFSAMPRRVRAGMAADTT